MPEAGSLKTRCLFNSQFRDLKSKQYSVDSGEGCLTVWLSDRWHLGRNTFEKEKQEARQRGELVTASHSLLEVRLPSALTTPGTVLRLHKYM